MPTATKRPGAANQPLPDYGGALVKDGALNAKVQQMLPSVIQTAPPGFGAGPHAGGMNQDQSSAWLTAAMRARGVQIPDGSHVLPSGQIIQDPGFWTRYGPAIMILASGLAVGVMAGGLGLGAAGTAGETASGLGIPGAELGMSSALPGAVNSIPALAGTGIATLPTVAGPAAEALASGPGAAGLPAGGSVPGSGSVTAGSEFADSMEPGIGGTPNVATPSWSGPSPAIEPGSGVNRGLLGAAAPHAVSDLAGSNIPSWLKPALQIGAPLAAGAFTHAGQQNTPGASPLDPETQGILKNILQLSQQRLESTVPVHEAAMRLAMSMAPNGQYSPRMQQSINETNQAPTQGPQMSPNVQEAYRRLMNGGA